MGAPRLPLGAPAEELLQQYEVNISTGCWEWTGPILPSGYGVTATRMGERIAHRLSYTFHVGPIAQGLLACHRCDNRRCINPDHIFLGTHRDNSMDAIAKGRWPMVGKLLDACVNGHAYDEANTGRRSDGHRYCRACKKATSHRNHIKRKERQHGLAA